MILAGRITRLIELKKLKMIIKTTVKINLEIGSKVFRVKIKDGQIDSLDWIRGSGIIWIDGNKNAREIIGLLTRALVESKKTRRAE